MDQLLTPDELGMRWGGKTRQSLTQMRYRGDGPKFLKIGRSIFYRLDDVLDFEESQLRTRTDDEPSKVA